VLNSVAGTTSVNFDESVTLRAIYGFSDETGVLGATVFGGVLSPCPQ